MSRTNKVTERECSVARGLHVIRRLSRGKRKRKEERKRKSASSERWRRVRRVLTVVSGDRSIAIANACALSRYCSLVQLAVAECTKSELWSKRGEKDTKRERETREREKEEAREKRRGAKKRKNKVISSESDQSTRY